MVLQKLMVKIRKSLSVECEGDLNPVRRVVHNIIESSCVSLILTKKWCVVLVRSRRSLVEGWRGQVLMMI